MDLFHRKATHALDLSENNYSILKQSLLDVIPNAIYGNFILSQNLLNSMPENPAEKLRDFVGSTITCFAIPITEDSLWVWHRHGRYRSLLANYILGQAARTAIDRLGERGVNIYEITQLVGQELSMVRLGELAGLGKRGWNNLLINELWGSWLQIHALLSNVIAPIATEINSDVCIKCGNCIKACPVKAVRPTKFNQIACSRVVASPTLLKSKAIALTENSYIECRECITSCPIGTNPEGIFEWVR